MAAIDLHVDPDPGISIASLVRTMIRRPFLRTLADPEWADHHGARAPYDRLGCRVVETHLASTAEVAR